jgi:hypothetical protein
MTNQEKYWLTKRAAMYHGSPVANLKELLAGSYVTPWEEDAASFGAPWGSRDLEEGFRNQPGTDGRPPLKLRFKGEIPPDHPLYIYKILKGALREAAATNTGAEYDWNSKVTEDTPVELVKTIPSWQKEMLDDDVQVLSAIPPGTRELVEKHGLLSSEALLNNPEVLKAVLANRKGTDWEDTEEEFRARVAEKLMDKFWGTSMKGPSVFFGEPDPDKITDKHPMSKLKSEVIKINLSKLLRDHPDTRISGTELVPYDPEGPEHQGDKRHKDIDMDKVREYAAMSPEELWKHYNNPEGTRYASDVPHAQIITPSGVIPSKYIT